MSVGAVVAADAVAVSEIDEFFYCLAELLLVLLATFGVARLSVQPRKLWLVVATDRDSRLACLYFFLKK